jgi:hypothetical protein
MTPAIQKLRELVAQLGWPSEIRDFDLIDAPEEPSMHRDFAVAAANAARDLYESMVVLSLLLDLHDPPSEAKRIKYSEDENGWSMALSGAVRVGRQIVPRPEPCSFCRGCGSDEYGAQCSDCDGDGFRGSPEPVMEAELATRWRHK